MKPTNSTLNAILASRQFYTADLYQITLPPPPPMNIVSVATNNTTNTVSVTVPANIPIGALIIIGIRDNNTSVATGSGPGSVSDGTNSYSVLSSAYLNGSSSGAIGVVLYAVTAGVLSAGSTITYTPAVPSSAAIQMTVSYITGADTVTPIDNAVKATAFGSSANPSVTSGAPQQTEMLVGFVAIGGTGLPLTPQVGWLTPPLPTGTGTQGIGGFHLANATTAVTFAPTANSSANWAAFVFGVTPRSSTLYYAQGQTDITYNGHVYLCGGHGQAPKIDRKDNKAKVTWRLGSGQDQLVIDLIPGSAKVFNLPFLSACRVGIFDAADFQLFRAFMTTYGVVQTGCAVLMFRGRIAEVDADRSIATFTINDYRELFNQQLPRNLFAASCMNTLGDVSCTVVLSSTLYSESGVVSANTDQFTLRSTSLLQQTDFYDNGKVVFTSGQLEGLSFGVSLFTNSATGGQGVALPVQPFPYVPQLGDAFTIFAGCDRSTGVGGCTKFSNIANFRGQPYIPAPETAL